MSGWPYEPDRSTPDSDREPVVSRKPPADTSWIQMEGDPRGTRERIPEKGVRVMSTQMADGIGPPSASMNPAESAIRVLPAVRAYIDGLGTLAGVKAPLAALAVWNARALENCRPDAPEAAKARLAQELRATLMSLTTEQTHDPDRLDRFLDEMGTPADLSAEVRDTPDSEPADVGSEGRGDRPSAR